MRDGLAARRRRICVLGDQREAERTPDEALARRRRDEQQLAVIRQARRHVHDTRLDPAQELLRPERVAPVRERDDDAQSAADERAELALGLCEPARGERGPLRLELVLLAGGQRIDRRTVSSCARRPARASARQRRRVARRGRLGRVERRHAVAALVSLCRLSRRVDGDGVERAQGALRIGRERADRLDLVPEQLDADGIAARRREDVEDPAAYGDLPTLLDALDPLVPRRHDPFDELLETGAPSPGEIVTGSGRRSGGGSGFDEASRGDADEPAAGEHVERSCTLADEVRRRPQARAERDAAARHEGDGSSVDEPGRRLGGVARVLVVGKHAQQACPAPLVERGEEQRQRRFGDAGARRSEATLRRRLAARRRRGRARADEGQAGP